MVWFGISILGDILYPIYKVCMTPINYNILYGYFSLKTIGLNINKQFPMKKYRCKYDNVLLYNKHWKRFKLEYNRLFPVKFRNHYLLMTTWYNIYYFKGCIEL